MNYKKWAAIVAAILLGLTFFVAGLGKLPAQTEAYMIIFGLQRALLHPTLANHLDTWLPRIEIILGLLLMVGVAAKLMAGFAGLLSVAFIFNNSWEIARGAGGDPCGCYGDNSFLGYLSNTDALYIDIGMLALAIVIILWYSGKWLSARPWFIKNS
ncbi:MauE/DoxX family redox-associated membrane protein [Chloroflexota bacterium]